MHVGAGQFDPRAFVAVASPRNHDLEPRTLGDGRLVHDFSSVSPSVGLGDREAEAGAVGPSMRLTSVNVPRYEREVSGSMSTSCRRREERSR
jgi:hypothetical protein